MYHAGTFYIIYIFVLSLLLHIIIMYVFYSTVLYMKGNACIKILQVHIHITTCLVLGGSTMHACSFP